MSKRALGRGIGALLAEEAAKEASGVTEVALASLKPNPHQPRKGFKDSSLKELADSIRQRGVLQPILAELDSSGAYTIVAGERRVRAARLAGLASIPVVVKSFSEEEKLEIALVENLQREDLTALEEAQAYKRLIELAGLNQEQLAARVGKDRSTIANSLRLLKLPEEVQGALSRGEISPGHARAILSIVNPSHQHVLFRRIVDASLSVRQAEQAASDLNKGKKPSRKNGKGEKTAGGSKEPEIRELEEKLIEHLGTKVEIKGKGAIGKIEIAYYSIDDLDRLSEILLK